MKLPSVPPEAVHVAVTGALLGRSKWEQLKLPLPMACIWGQRQPPVQRR